MPTAEAEALNRYGVDIAMASSGDFAVNAAGDLATVGEVQVVAQALQMRVRTALGDLTLHPQYGMNLPTGGKMDPEAVAAAVNGELGVTVEDDPRIRSATVTSVEYPANANPTAISLAVLVVLAGGEKYEVSGLPAEVRVSEVSYTANVTGESGLTPFEEAPFFADEQTTAEIESEAEVDSLINDLPGS